MLHTFLAHTCALAGIEDEARATLDELLATSHDKYVPAFNVAVVYLSLGEHDAAFEWLDRALAARSSWLISMNVDPLFEPLRKDSRFTDLVAKVGLS